MLVNTFSLFFNLAERLFQASINREERRFNKKIKKESDYNVKSNYFSWKNYKKY